MKIVLKTITENNYDECINLTVREDQPFVASNLYSIEQAKAERCWITRAVYAGIRMVGFVMYTLDNENNELYLCRFMIDKRYQGQGYGTAALKELKELALNMEGVEKITLSTNPENASGIRFYEKNGFVDTHTIDEGEEVFILELGK